MHPILKFVTKIDLSPYHLQISVIDSRSFDPFTGLVYLIDSVRLDNHCNLICPCNFNVISAREVMRIKNTIIQNEFSCFITSPHCFCEISTFQTSLRQVLAGRAL